MSEQSVPAATPFAHLDAPHSSLYRDVMGAFMRAKVRFTVHLRPEDVAASIDRSVEPDAVVHALEQLVRWGNLRADPDTARVTSVEDFHRARYLYQLTVEGEAAEQALGVYEQAIGRRGALQSVALTDIAVQLRALLRLAEDAQAAGVAPDAAKTHLLLISISDRFAGLADNAQAFMASLRRTIDFADVDVDAFIAYKERLIAYIERFIADLANQGAEIADLARRVEDVGVVGLLEVAGRREAADAGPGDADDDDVLLRFEAEAVRRWRDRWDGLRTWFLSVDASRPSQSRLLRSAAIGAITQLLSAVSAINERRAGVSDRSADFRTLARWFAEAADEGHCHRLWRAAFGLNTSRHLTATPETLDEWDELRLAASTPWAEAAPVRISPQLRRTGSYERRGQPNRVIDRSAARRALAEQAASEAAQVALARARLATNGPARLSELGRLDPLEFRLFLSLLGDALAARVPGEREVATSSGDGTMLVRLVAVDGAPPVRIETLDGELSGPEHVIEIVDMIAPRVEVSA